jgi:hypothetical protein
MKTLPNWRLVSLVTLAVGAIVGVACSGDDEVTETPTLDGGSKDAGNKDTGPAQDTGIQPGTDGGVDAGSDSSITPQGNPPGCFSGTPVNSLDFLNACTDAAYVLFDDCTRLGAAYCDGGLPPLVTPPVDAGPDVVDTGVPDTGTDTGTDTGIDDAATDGG